MFLPGDYYWITWTSSNESPDVKKSWHALQRFLHRYRPDMVWIYCITTEGNGVIHMITRLPKGTARLEISELRVHWEKLHKAWSVVIKKVYSPQGLSDYLAEQGRKRGMAGEMYFQPLLVRWRCSRGWIPLAFGKAYGRFWQKCRNLPETVREQVLREWLLDITEDYKIIKQVPYLDKNEILRRN
jgi:hypothetical protein